MPIKILTNEKNVLELELEGIDQSVAQILAERLSQESDVEFASYKLDHPTVASPKLYVRTKKGDPTKIVLGKVKELKEELSEFKTKFAAMIKK